MSGKRAIPHVANPQDMAQAKFNQAVKENIEVLIGLRGGKLSSLASDATLSDVVAKINEMIERIQ